MKKRILAILITIFIACAYLLVAAYRDVKQREIDKINAQQMAHARLAASAIENFIQQYQSLLELFAKSPDIASLNDNGRLMMKNIYDRRQKDIRSITRINAEGRFLYTIPDDAKYAGADISWRPFFKEMKQHLKPAVSEIITSVKGVRGIAFHAPVIKEGKFDGSMAVFISPYDLAEKYLRSIAIGKSGYAWLINQNGVEIYCPVPGHIGETVYKTSGNFPSVIAMAEKMMRGEQGVTTYAYDRIRGGKTDVIVKHAVYTPIKIGETLWSVVVATPEDDVLANMRGFTVRWTLIVLLLLVGIAITGFMLLKALFIFRERESRNKTEQALRESEARYRTLIENVPVAVFRTTSGPQGSWVFGNQKLLTIMGAESFDELSRHSVSDLYVNPSERIHFSDRVIKDGYIENFEVQYKNLHGKIFWGSTKAKTIKADGNGVFYFDSFMEDITERKHAEQAIRDSEGKYRKFIDNAPIAMCTVDRDERFTYGNSKLYEISGYSAERWIGKTLQSVIHPEDYSLVKGNFLRRIAGHGSNEPYDVRYINAAGDIRWASLTPQIILDKDGDGGKIAGIQVFIEDVTDRKKVAEEMTIKDIAISSSLSAIAVFDSRGAVTYVNDSFLKMWKYRREEALGRRACDLWNSAAEAERVIEKIRQEGSWLGTMEALAKDGQLFTVQMASNLVVGSNERPLFMVASFIDISERVMVEKALKESEERFRIMFESAQIAIFIKDTAMKYRLVNPATEHLFEASSKEFVGKDATEFFSGEYGLPIDAIDRKVLDGEIFKGEEVIRTRSGKRFIEVVKTPMRNYNGEIIGLCGVARDITEIRTLRDQLHNAQKMEAIGTLAGGIAHDFNNILGGIMGYSELALNDTPMAYEVVRSYIRRVLEASERAKSLVQQILRFSRRDTETLICLDVKPLIKEAIKLLRATLPSTIAIEESTIAERCTIIGDPTRIHQIIMNLSTNAYHAMRETGGKLSISLLNETLKERRCSFGIEIEPGEYLVLAVKDTGTGIPPETINRIFDPYFTTKKLNEGTGLGLAVVFGIVKSLGGYIEVESIVGRGTEMRIFFPLKEIGKHEVHRIEEILVGGGEHILIVDDEPFFLDVLKVYLESLGYRVSVTNNSLETLERFRNERETLDLIITDQTMPNLTGLQLAAEIRKTDKKIPIILCTGFSEMISEQSLSNFGISRLLMKPITRTELARAVHAVLEKGS
ncbi:MAG: PAS domain S-box protein [Deltaproteobacteria bacterium]|nr:PAS domain S-box protein [Deltaproteobacteria bacterium]